MTFLEALSADQPLLMDGAMGTELLPLGLRCVEEANLRRSARVRAIHSAHVAAGARVLLTNTFQANPGALARHGLEDLLEKMAWRAIQHARQAAPDCFVLGDVGPIVPAHDREALTRTLVALRGVDAILFETWSSPAVLPLVEYALHRVFELENIPLLLSLTYQIIAGKPVTYSGHPPEWFARHAIRHGVAALGVNCGKEIDVQTLVEILGRYRQETDLPLFVRPNAGTPGAQGGYPRSPEGLATAVPSFLAAGATMVGGCCGTTETHLAAMAACLHDYEGSRRSPSPR
jgi:methionine synthase I (cobalamin-dependent)